MADGEIVAKEPKTQKPIRLAYLVSHPIQYQAPLLRLIVPDPRIELKVFHQWRPRVTTLGRWVQTRRSVGRAASGWLRP